jgi:dTDP-4-amino-4,6-dideoxygalactose transaminase
VLRNFGHAGPNDFTRAGINAKNSELHAALGLSNLPYIDQNLCLRRSIVELYDRNLSGLPLRRPLITERSTWNYAYYPVVFESEALMLRVIRNLNSHDIYPRRYFFPSLSNLPFIERRGSTPVSDDIAHRVLCLPLYPSLSKDTIDNVCRLVRGAIAS